MPDAIDLFSGCGGMTSGFRAAGFRILGAVDRQKAKPSAQPGTTRCNSTYEANHGVAPLDADLAQLDPFAHRDSLGLFPGELHVLIACAPCTGFSQKNPQNAQRDDHRNSLVRHMARWVDAYRPKFLVMENVAQMLTGRLRWHFDALRDELAARGYRVTATVHDLSEFGLPQRRRRALVVASRDGDPRPPGLDWQRRTGTVRDTISHLPALEAGDIDPDDPQHTCPNHTVEVLDRIRHTPHDGGSWADLADTRPDLLIPSMRRRIEEGRTGSFPDAYGRARWDQPSVTITRECANPGNGRFVHPDQDRMLSVREMALLQGFPADYQFVGPLTARYNQIGDAVPPMIAELIARDLRAAIV